MDRSASLAGLIDAGVTAFKIEGRLKDDSYVEDVTAYYRKRLDAIIDGDPGLKRQSCGRTGFFFEPDPRKTFHRGGTDYFLHEEDDGMWSPDTPKSTGEEIGSVTKCGPNWFCLSEGEDRIHPGDGLCFLDSGRELRGIQVNSVADSCIRSRMAIQDLRPGMKVFRNRDHDFLRRLGGETSDRRVGLELVLRETGDGFVLDGTDEEGTAATASLVCDKVKAEKPEAALETMQKQLSRLNETIYGLKNLKIESEPYFLRTAELNRLRRDLVDAMEERRRESYVRPKRAPAPDPSAAYPVKELGAGFNISNSAAREFYSRHGAAVLAPAFEIVHPPQGFRVMITRHCIRRSMGACLREQPSRTLPSPLFLHHAGRRFRLEFDCGECRMHVILD
jgi:putative protease